MQTTVLIPGMHCQSCTEMVREISGEFPQIENVEVDLETKQVILNHGVDFDLQSWIEEIQSLGETYAVVIPH